MAVTWHLLGSLLLVAFLCAGVLMIVAPALGLRVLKNTAAVFGALMLGFMIIRCCVVLMLHFHIPSTLAFWMVSALAYFYCERTRFRKQPNRLAGSGAVERERVDAGRQVVQDPNGEAPE